MSMWIRFILQVQTPIHMNQLRDMINIAKSDLFIYSSDDLDPVAKTITQSMTNDDMKLAVAY